MDTLEIRSEVPWKFWYVTQEKGGKISRTDFLKNEVLRRVNEDRDVLHKIRQRKANWIGYTLLRNYLLKHFIDGNIEGKNRGNGKMRKKT
jgi:hypothetical protein